MAQATGALTKILGLTETEFNEAPAVPDAEVLYVRTFEGADGTTREQDPTLAGGYRGQLRGVEGRAETSITAAVSLAPQSIGFWLKHLIGQPTTTGAAAPYTHTFRVDNDANPLPPGIMFEQGHGTRISGAGRHIHYNGCRIGSASFAFTTTTPAQQATFNLIGASRPVLAADTVDATPNDPGHAAWSVSGITLALDDGDTEICVESLNLSWDNDLDTDLFCLNNGGQRHGLPEGQVIITGDFVAQFDTPVLLQRAFADEDLKIVLVLQKGNGSGTQGNEKLTLTIPLASTNRPIPPVNGPRGLKQNVTFVAHREGGQEIGVTAVLQSPRPSI